ncbi:MULTISPECIES: hypothetical protein [unclassified Microcoleus]|uniref:hypothetical protein n=1 Tax=unclassified Microcoleus TaxID=2642155 RepID=UPI002FD107E0
MAKIKFELAAAPSKAEKYAKRQSEFVPSAARWGKRTFQRLGGKMQKLASKTLIAHSLVQMPNSSFA